MCLTKLAYYSVFTYHNVGGENARNADNKLWNIAWIVKNIGS